MKIRFVQTGLIAALMLGCACSPSSEAKKSSPAGSSGGDLFNAEAQAVISKLSHNPELMNIEYLKFFIGRAENESYARNSMNPHYYWYDGNRRLTYELEQVQSAPGQVVESKMTVHMNGEGPQFSELSAVFGEPIKHFYDQNAHPAELYSFAPNTLLIFSSPPNTFSCSQAKITYSGAPLSMPLAAEMDLANSSMIGRGASLQPEELDADSLPLLQARVKTQSQDPEAHFALAQNYVQQNQLHNAIGEYKVALALSGANTAIRDKALNALRKMRVIDDSYDPTGQRGLELVHHGQALKASDSKTQPPPLAPPIPPNGGAPF